MLDYIDTFALIIKCQCIFNLLSILKCIRKVSGMLRSSSWRPIFERSPVKKCCSSTVESNDSTGQASLNSCFSTKAKSLIFSSSPDFGSKLLRCKQGIRFHTCPIQQRHLQATKVGFGRVGKLYVVVN